MHSIELPIVAIIPPPTTYMHKSIIDYYWKTIGWFDNEDTQNSCIYVPNNNIIIFHHNACIYVPNHGFQVCQAQHSYLLLLN